MTSPLLKKEEKIEKEEDIMEDSNKDEESENEESNNMTSDSEEDKDSEYTCPACFASINTKYDKEGFDYGYCACCLDLGPICIWHLEKCSRCDNNGCLCGTVNSCSECLNSYCTDCMGDSYCKRCKRGYWCSDCMKKGYCPECFSERNKRGRRL